MSRHSVTTITIDAPSSVVFDVVHDYRARPEWDTLLRRAQTIDGAPPGKDVVAVCAAKWRFAGLVFATRYVSFDRPNLAAVTLVRPYFVFDMWSASIRHRDLGPGAADTGHATSADPPTRSQLIYTLTLRCRPQWLARPLEAVAVRMFAIETSRRLSALKRYIEGGDRGRARRRSSSELPG